MKALPLKYRDRIRSSFCFVPAVMTCLAVCAVALDKAIAKDWLLRPGLSNSGVQKMQACC